MQTLISILISIFCCCALKSEHRSAESDKLQVVEKQEADQSYDSGCRTES